MTKLKEDFEASGGVWKQWRIDDIFLVKTPKKKFNANAVTFGSNHPYVVRTSQNNGVRAYLDEDEKYLNDAKTISFGQDTATMFYQEKPYFTGDKIKIMKFKDGELTSLTACYLLASMYKSFSLFSWGTTSFNEDVLNSELVNLPTFNNEPSYSYMEQYISMLEEEKMLQVDKFLKDSGLNDTTLTAEETSALEKFRNGEVKFEERKIGDLFEKIKTHKLPYKAESLPKVKIGNNTLPCLTSSFQNQGLNYYVPESNATVLQNVITIPSNSDVYRAYFQSVRFTVLSDAYAIERKDKGLKTTGEQYLFMVACINKVTDKSFYSYKNKLGGWNVVQEKEFNLPVNSDGDIDYTFMQHFISALEKLVIRGVVKYKDEVLNADGKALDFAVAAEPISSYGQKLES